MKLLEKIKLVLSSKKRFNKLKTTLETELEILHIETLILEQELNDIEAKQAELLKKADVLYIRNKIHIDEFKLN